MEKEIELKDLKAIITSEMKRIQKMLNERNSTLPEDELHGFTKYLEGKYAAFKLILKLINGEIKVIQK